MAPAKRKRPERQASEDDPSARSSPYRPEKSRMASRRTSKGNALAQEAGGDAQEAAELADNAPANGEPASTQAPASNAATPTPAAESTPVPIGSDEATMEDNAPDQRPPYNYIHLTDDIVSTWTGGGEQNVVEGAAQFDELQVGDLLQELIRSALDGRLAPQQAGHAFRKLKAAREEGDGLDVEFLFLNTLSFLYDAHYKGKALPPLVAATGIDQDVMRQELDISLLQDLGLVRSTFEKMRTRKTTNALYRQANFNLLREESEGYAKLITDYFNTAEEAFASRDEDSPYMAEDAFQRVKALVGAFDLDVGRVLDITLDVSANLLVKAYPFFIKFYRASSWWPSAEALDNVKWQNQGFSSLPSWALPGSGTSTITDDDRHSMAALRQDRDVYFWDQVREQGIKAFFEIGARKIVDLQSVLPLLEQEVQPELDSRGKESNPNRRHRLNEDRKHMRETGCLPPPGNYDAAQLLGFKLRFYASDARDAADILPDNLIYLVALLIKIGFVSLRDLYPHLYPSDEDMKSEKTKLEKEKAEKEAKDRPGGGTNALLAAGALSDDTPAIRNPRIDKEKSGGATPAPDKKDEVKDDLPPPANQKLMLLRALLLIGALPEALFMLGRFPWLAEVDVSLPPFLFRIAKHMLSKMLDSLRPLSKEDGLQNTKDLLTDTTAQSDGMLPTAPRILKKPVRWLHNDCFSKEGTEYKHYYSDWSDNIPVCQNLKDVYTVCDTFFGFLGPKIGQDVVLFQTILRLADSSLKEDSGDDNRAKWLSLIRRLIIPALSCSRHNVQLTQSVYDLLKSYPTATRYNIYAEWFLGSTSRLPDVRVAFARNKAEVKDVLRRVSNETVKKQGRALSKIALASPGIVMIEMISQLEAYSNMIPSLVECTKFFSPMANDVLVWALINSLSGSGRNRMQGDGMLTSPWLQALAHFVATLFSRYTTTLDPVPVLQYLASRLRVGETTDLEVFEQLLVEMAGIRSDVEFNDAQVIAMAGGEHLQSYIMQQLSDARHSDTKKRPAKKLIQALNGSGLTGQFIIAIAQDRLIYAHDQDLRHAPLKVVGNNLDKISAVFAQYLEVLKTNLKVEELESAVPDVGALVTEFGLEPSVAVIVRRAALRLRITEHDAAKKQEEEAKKSKTAVKDEAGDLAMTDSSVKVEPENDENSEALEEGEAADAAEQSVTDNWHPVLQPVIDQLSEALPELAARVSIPFYVTFWTLMHQDILVPTDSYQKETERISQTIKDIAADRSDVTATVAKKRDERKRDLQKWHDKLKSEPMPHMAAFLAVRQRVIGAKKGKHVTIGENSFWFPKSKVSDPQQIKVENDSKHQALLQECFLPRAILSAVDAHFSFEMLKMMHSNGTPGFSLMHLLVQLFKKKQLTSFIFQCTANEAQHFARFLWEVLKLVHRWHADQGTYEKEALGSKRKLPGFVKTFEENGEPKSVMDFETFRRMLFNFHSNLNSSLQACFESAEYMHIRNGIIVLKGIHQVFPALNFMGKNMIDQIEKLSQEDPRGDLKLAAMSLRGPLRNREKDWVMPQKFRLGVGGEKEGGKGADSASPETIKLNANAPDFKPSRTDGNGPKESVVGAAEDGEIEDGVTKDTDTEMKDAGDPKTGPESKPPHKDASKPSDARSTRSAAGRDTPKQDSKPATPVPLRSAPQPTVPPRPEERPSSARADSSRSSDLTSRPERPQPYKPAPPPARLDRPDNRFPSRGEARDDRYGRLERPGDARPSSREQSPSHRSGRGRTPPASVQRSSHREERPFERHPNDTRYGRDESYSARRDPAQLHGRPSQNARDRPAMSSRASEGSGLHPDRMGNISSVAVAPERERAAAPSQPQQQDSQVSVNPARLAMITGDQDTSSRGGRERHHGERDQRRERESRMDERSGPPQFQGRADTRSNNRGPQDVPRDMPPPRAEPQQDLAPRGPRPRGRLSEANGPHVESSYGRLNAPAEPPSGPKNAAGGRNGRNFTAPQSSAPSGPSAQSSNTVRPADAQSSSRGPPRHANDSAPGTPGNENGPAVHPSRAAQLGQPAPIQTSFGAPNGPRNNAGSPINAAPPSGPRGPPRAGGHGPPSGTPTGPSPASNNLPPSGPGMTAQSRAARSQRNSINGILQSQPSTPTQPGPAINIRGAARQSSGTGLPVASGGPMGPPQSRGGMEEQPSGRGDLFQSRSNRGDDRNSRHRDEERQSNSRQPSRERPHGSNSSTFGQQPPPPPPAPVEDGRNRRGGREDRPPRDDRSRDAPRGEYRTGERPQDNAPRRALANTPGSFNGPLQGEWDRNQRAVDDGRRGGRIGGGPMTPTGPSDFRGPPRHDDPRRGPSHREDGPASGPDGRKRRHGAENEFSDPNKRRRSGR